MLRFWDFCLHLNTVEVTGNSFLVLCHNPQTLLWAVLPEPFFPKETAPIKPVDSKVWGWSRSVVSKRFGLWPFKMQKRPLMTSHHKFWLKPAVNPAKSVQGLKCSWHAPPQKYSCTSAVTEETRRTVIGQLCFLLQVSDASGDYWEWRQQEACWEKTQESSPFQQQTSSKDTFTTITTLCHSKWRKVKMVIARK